MNPEIIKAIANAHASASNNHHHVLVTLKTLRGTLSGVLSDTSIESVHYKAQVAMVEIDKEITKLS